MTIEEIRKGAPPEATHYKELKSFTGEIKYLYYKVIGNFVRELVSARVSVLRKIDDMDLDKLKPL